MSFTERFLLLIIVVCLIQITLKSRQKETSPHPERIGSVQKPHMAFGWYLGKNDVNKSLTKALGPSGNLELSSGRIPTRTGRGRGIYGRTRRTTKQLSPEGTTLQNKKGIIEKRGKTSLPYIAFHPDSETEDIEKTPTRTTRTKQRPKENSNSIKETEELPIQRERSALDDYKPIWKGPHQPWFAVNKEHMQRRKKNVLHGSGDVEYNSEY
ncbi:unnamed protein product [Spodoptera exigua]|nr:unnamed protein product [Spodoptera exigua]